MTDVLFISRQRVVGATNGSSAYLLQMAEAVRRAGMRPHLLQPSPTLMGRWPLLRLRPEMKVFESHLIRGVWRVGPFILSRSPAVYAAATWGVLARLARRLGASGDWARDRPLPYAIARAWTDGDRRFVQRKGSGRCSVAIADYMFQAEAFSSLPVPKDRTAILMHDLFHARRPEDAGTAAADSVATIDRDREIALLSQAGAVIAIQGEEAEFLRENVQGTFPILAPMAARPVTAAQPGDSDTILFVGSKTAPNTTGLRWFMEKVWPIVRAANPQAKLEVAGTVCQEFAEAPPAGVHFLGLVDDLNDYYRRAGLVISPLLFGSGLKVKLIEALSKGKAVIATDVTLQGVEEQCGRAVARANGAEEFASRILALQRDEDERLRLAQTGLEAARAHFAPEAAFRSFIEWLGSPDRAAGERSRDDLRPEGRPPGHRTSQLVVTDGTPVGPPRLESRK